MKPYHLSVLVNNHAGLLAKVAGLFSRRHFNIDSLAVGVAETPGQSRMTIVVNGDEQMVEQVVRQLDKLIDVLEIEVLPDQQSVQRELLLIKMSASPETRSEILQVAEIFRAHIVDVSHDSLTLEVTGQADKIAAFLNLLQPLGIRQVIRTGTVAIRRS
ncbi:MAG: acetolactate synthase small subunit [Clostridia bacterium]|nr:acetolactate synthase small subunit [Eubacteriales bacterium]MDD3866687.1 acetolactate synthase small subunit [Eubacteriales bacterium]MDD4461470.1 acetolactate synthase small subunit [Eubacteriales bacterium]NCC47884.1 acetolactate synthase small subunit [Clostridia bacterium]